LSYVVGLALYPPRVLTVVDEDRYVSQALAFARGAPVIEGSGIVVPPVQVRAISDYPPGTSLLQTPFVAAFGWRGAILVSLASLILATLFTAAWLRDAGKPVGFALFVPGFAAVPVFGRIAMSDMPSGALVAFVCWSLWKSESGNTRWSVVTGLAAGASLLLREPLAVLLAPLLLGAVIRRRARAVPLFLGGAVGVTLRLVLSKVLFGSAVYVRDSGITFSLGSLAHTIPVYAAILLVMFPMGALLPFFYRGQRRLEVVVAVVAYVLLFLLYDYDVIRGQGPVKGLLLAARFMIPVVPLLAWMAADVWPRILNRGGARAEQAISRLAPMGVAGIGLMAFAVHPIAHRQERDFEAIVTGIFSNTDSATAVVTNSDATLKYFSAAYGRRRLILRQSVRPDSVPALLSTFGRLDIVLLDRLDSEMFRRDADANSRFLADLNTICQLALKYEQDFAWAKLRLFGVRGCRAPGEPPAR